MIAVLPTSTLQVTCFQGQLLFCIIFMIQIDSVCSFVFVFMFILAPVFCMAIAFLRQHTRFKSVSL